MKNLLRAGNWEKAHGVLCGTVGPKAVIEEDYGTLRDVLRGFTDDGVQHIETWKAGGKVYRDFVNFVQGDLQDEDKIAVLKGLLNALPEMGSQDMAFEARVAVEEMSGGVAKKVLEMRGKVRRISYSGFVSEGRLLTLRRRSKRPRSLIYLWRMRSA